MKVGIFGCSWSSDKNKGASTSWPREFARLNPEYEVYNMSWGGTCIRFSIENLIEFKNQWPDSKTIFQVTHLNRFTYKKPKMNIFDYIENVDKNYYRFNGLINSKIYRHSGGKASGQVNNEILKYYQQQCLYNIYETIDFKALTEYAKQISELVFAHKIILIDDFNIPCVEKICGEYNFRKYQLDYPHGHFNTQGSIWQANLINEMFHEIK